MENEQSNLCLDHRALLYIHRGGVVQERRREAQAGSSGLSSHTRPSAKTMEVVSRRPAKKQEKRSPLKRKIRSAAICTRSFTQTFPSSQKSTVCGQAQDTSSPSAGPI